MAIQPNGNFTIAKQEFLNSVINKIGRQEFSDMAYQNPLKAIKGGFVENASAIEEIFVEKIEDTDYDPDGQGVLDRVKPTVYTQYHTNKVTHGYKVSIQDFLVKEGFTNKGGISQVANHILQSLHNGAELDEYNDVIDTLKALVGAKKDTNTFSLTAITDEATGKAFVKQLKKLLPYMTEYSTDYSAKNTFSNTSNMILFLDSDVEVELNTEMLADTFHMDKRQLNDTTKIVVPKLKQKLGNNTFAVLCDKRCLKINPTYYNIESIRNTRGKFTNYDLVTETFLSYTDWYNFAVFVEV